MVMRNEENEVSQRRIVVPGLVLPPKEIKPIPILVKANLFTGHTEPGLVMTQFDQMIGLINTICENLKFIPVKVFICHKGTEFIDLAEHLYMAECEAQEKQRKEVERKDEKDVNTNTTTDDNKLE